MARPRKPDHLKIVAGTAQPCRMNPKAPKPARGAPNAPSHLSARGKVGWADAAAIAESMGVLTQADGAALELLAEALADLRAARASLARPLVLAGKELAGPGERYYWAEIQGGASLRKRPELSDISDADRRVSAWLSKFGLTPADRSRVSADTSKDENPFDEIFGNG